MKKLLIFIIIITASQVHAQINLNDYPGLMSEGEMPQSFRDGFTSDKKSEDDTFMKTLFQSGKVVYGTSLNRYLDTILGNLLVNNAQLRDEISLFVVKSPNVNAYATTRGYIFVNTGLLAQATNEAEIAFILAHEIVHIADKHEMKLEKNGDFNHYLNYHNRSRENENDADRYALQRYYASSKYSYKAMEGVFDVLQYGYLPFDNLPFKRSMVETGFYTFPDKYYLENVKPIRSREDYIDTLSTHPNILKRRTAAKNICDTKNDEGRLAFVQSKDLFDQIQSIARLECIHQYLIRHDYGNAYYNAYVLAQTSMPENSYLQNAMAIAVYGLSKHKQGGSLREVLPRPSDIEGEKQQIYHFFGELSRQELNVLAIRLLWQAYKKSSGNEHLLAMCADAIKDMLGKNKLNLNDFSDYPANAEITEEGGSAIDTTTQNASQSKYDRIKSTSITKVKPSEKFKTVNYMLVDLKQDEGFVALVQQTKNDMEDESIINLVQSASNKGIGNNGILFLEPFYQFVKDYNVVAKKSAAGKKEIANVIKKGTRKLDMNATIIEKKQLVTFTTDQYNQYSKIMDWLQDVYNISENMVFYRNNEMKQIASDLNCKYISLVSITMTNGRYLSYDKFQDLAFSIICPVVAPAYITKFFFPRRESQISVNVIEIETGKVFFAQRNNINATASQAGLVNAYLYDCLYQIKKGGNK